MKVLAAFLALSLSSVAFGQLRRSTGAPVLPAVSTAAPDGAFALETNPAALALQNGWDLAYVHADRVGDDELAARGDGLYGSTTLPFRLAIAASVDWIRPTTGAERGRFSLGAAWARSRRFALGGALRYSASSDPIGGVTSLDVSALWRPSSTITFSLVAHDLLGPAGLVTDAADVPATFALAAQLRPFATDGLTVEVVGALDTDGRVGVRALAAAVIPRIGRVWGSLEGDDLRDTSDLRATVGLDVRFGNGSVTGGAILGDDLTGWITAARLSSHERVGLPTPGYVDDIEVKSAGPRSLLALLNRLDRDRGDRRVRGVLLRLRGTSMGLAAAQEVRAAIGALQASGKPVVCHADTLSGSETYACSAAAGSYVDPAGYVRLLGPSLEVMNFGEALENVGVRADFVRIGDFKSAVEQYTNGAMSGPARLQRNALLDDVYTRMTEDMAVDRDVPPAAVRRWVDGGPYIADEAVDLGVATEILDEHDLGPILRETIGTSRRRRTPPEDARRTVGVPRRIAVVVVDGSIVDGNNVDLPIIEIHQTGGRTITQTLDALIADRTVAAIVVRIDSPGGSALASEQIWRAIRRARRSKPVIATMGAVAASGGYYIASACDEIYADPSTITGSIGIFFGKADFGPLANRLGVSVTQIGRGRHAGATSLYRPFTAEERGVIADKIRRFYRLFLQRVAEGREELDVEDVDRLGRGRVWTGDAA
ncbi:MAG: signal peptide peptidase SppA, partial [Myxococcota bacterium]